MWIQQHYEGFVAVCGALWTLISVINGLVGSPQVKSVLGKVLDALAFIARRDAVGSVKAPFTASKTEAVEIKSVEAVVTATVTKPAPEPEVKP